MSDEYWGHPGYVVRMKLLDTLEKLCIIDDDTGVAGYTDDIASWEWGTEPYE